MLYLPCLILTLALPAANSFAQPAAENRNATTSDPASLANEPIGDDAKWSLIAEEARTMRIRLNSGELSSQDIILSMEVMRDDVELYLAEQPYDHRAWNLMANLCGELRDSNCVDESARELLELQPGNIQTGLQWASYYAQSEDYSGSLRVLNLLLDSNPSNLMYNNAWLITMDAFDPDGITSRFASLIIEPGDLTLAKAMATARRQSNPWMARSMAEQLFAVAPSDPEVIEIMGRSYRATNQFRKARAILSALPPELLKQPHLAYLYSDCHYADHDFERAYELMTAIDMEAAAERPGLDRRLRMMLPLREMAIPSHARELEIQAREREQDSNPLVRLTIDGKPVMIELFQDQAPNTSAAFLALARRGDYDDIPFGQVQTGFRSIGGTIDGGVPYSLPSECGQETDRHFFSGTLAMYLPFAGRPDSGRGEWCMYHFPAPHLNGERTVFGRVTEGLDHVRAMKEDSRLERVEIIREPKGIIDPVVIDDQGVRRTFSQVMSNQANGNATARP